MAKKVIWSHRAQNDRKKILKFWIENNGSNAYSIKLNNLFVDAINLISAYPEIGYPTNFKNARIKIVRNYQIIYEVSLDYILILTIWDNKRNPKVLESILKK